MVEIFAQVVRAKQDGLAARLVAQNPPLLQLRWLQVLGERSGNTVVLGVQSGPIPIAPGSSGAPELPESAGEGGAQTLRALRALTAIHVSVCCRTRILRSLCENPSPYAAT